MDLQRISAPLSLAQKLTVVSLEEAKAQERVLQNREDVLISGWIEAAYDFLSGPEGWTNGYCLLEETFEFFLDEVCNTIELPVRRFTDGDLVSFEMIDATTGGYAAVDPSLYTVVRNDDYGVIASLSGRGFSQYEAWWRRVDWNAWQARFANTPRLKPRAYRIRFSAGWADPAHIPSPLKQAIRMLVGHWYQNRETVFADPRQGNVSREIEYGLKALAGRYRVSPDHS